MMCIISKTIYLSSVFSLAIPMISFNPAYASLVDTSQNQTFESRPVNSIKLAAVHFITNDGALNFGNQEFLPGDLCKQGGYTYEGCPSGYLKGEACPYDSKFVKDCIDPDTWCRNNGYSVTSCTIPKYLASPCPYKSTLYKSCETDNIRACKELGYTLTCETGKVGGEACPYNSSYKKCVCNPCAGFDYTAEQASAQGYVPGEVCNSCGTIKYKRSENACDGFQECTNGGTTAAEVCYSGSVKKFSECSDGCDEKYKYTKADCTGDYIVDTSQGWCYGKYIGCKRAAKILYGDGSVGMVSEIYVNKNKTPIGFVIDEENRLAAALTNVTEAGTLIDKKVKFASGISGSLELQRFSNYNLCLSSSGRVNTKAMLNAANSTVMLKPFEAAELANRYQPAGCSHAFCQKGNWFLPSVEEWVKMRDESEAILNSISNLYDYVYSPEVANFYGLKSEESRYYKDEKLIEKAREDVEGKYSGLGYYNLTPVWLAKDEIYFTNGIWNYNGYLSASVNLYRTDDWSSLHSVRPLIAY